MIKVIVIQETDGSYFALAGNETLGTSRTLSEHIIFAVENENYKTAFGLAREEARKRDILKIDGLPGLS